MMTTLTQKLQYPIVHNDIRHEEIQLMEEDVMDDTQQDEEAWYYPHLLAQGLSNEAASMISRGEDLIEAIRILSKALDLAQTHFSDENDEQVMPPLPCSLEHCSLDECIFQEDCNNTERGPLEKIGKDLKYVFHQPLRVPEACNQGNHYMGTSLTVVIIYNLAIAHQILNMSKPTSWSNFNEQTRIMDKALRLYELCIHANTGSDCSDAADLRLKLLVMNNISEIHRMMGQAKKHRMCLEYMHRVLNFIAHGRVGGWDYEVEILRPEEMDTIYRSMQSCPTVLGNNVHAGAA